MNVPERPPLKPKWLAAGGFRRQGIYWLPNAITTLALFAGFYAIVQAMNNRFELAAMAIFVAMVLDGMDRSDWAIGSATVRRNSRAASSSAWRSPAHW